jgi:hypothetical protein
MSTFQQFFQNRFQRWYLLSGCDPDGFKVNPKIIMDKDIVQEEFHSFCRQLDGFVKSTKYNFYTSPFFSQNFLTKKKGASHLAITP